MRNQPIPVVTQKSKPKPIHKKLSHNDCCGVHPPPSISHFHLSLLFHLSSTITSRSHPLSSKNTSINLSPSKSPFTTLYLLSIATTASIMVRSFILSVRLSYWYFGLWFVSCTLGWPRLNHQMAAHIIYVYRGTLPYTLQYTDIRSLLI